MIVRFDPKRLQHNTMADIGVEHDGTRDKTAISEVEMIVGEARRQSIAARDGVVEENEDQEDIKNQVIREQEEEEQEPGPELTPEGQKEADRILTERRAGNSIHRETTEPADASKSTS